jgi:hypothetical protein
VTLVLSAMVVGFLVFADLNVWIRPLVTLWFLAVCPGMAFIRLLRIKDRRTEWSLAIALSVALATLAAAASLYAKAWSSNGVLAALICLTVVGVVLQGAASFRIVPRSATAPGQ